MARLILPSGKVRTVPPPHSIKDVEKSIGGKPTMIQCGIDIIIFCGASTEAVNTFATMYAKSMLFWQDLYIHGKALVISVAEVVQSTLDGIEKFF